MSHSPAQPQSAPTRQLVLAAAGGLLVLGAVGIAISASGSCGGARLAGPTASVALQTEAQGEDEPQEPAEGVQVEAPEVVAEAGGLRIETQLWRAGHREGIAWRVRAPRETAVDIVPSATDVAFRELLPQDEPAAWAALNGGFYEGHAAMGLVVSDGEQHSALGKRGGSGVLDWGPEPARIVHRDTWAPGAREALQSVDRLVDGGKSLVNHREGRPQAARSAVALTEDAIWLVALVDRKSLGGAPGRQRELRLAYTVGAGLTLAEFADYLVAETGAQQALNMDGAISTQLAADVGDTSLRIWGEHTTINAVVVRGAVEAP